jgi:hypothetical protein
MASNSTSLIKIIGLALMIVGVGMAIWGFQLSGSFESEVTQAVTGSDTDQVMTLYIGGAVSFVVGIFMFFMFFMFKGT